MTPSPGRLRAALVLGLVLARLAPAPGASAASYVPVNGGGSSWSSNAVDQWRRNVEQYGMRVNYASTGSVDGRNQFKAGTVDFAVTETPYGLTDNGVLDTLPSRSFAYMPIVAGGTAFMYNLQVGGKRLTGLRLSGEVLTKIFTGVVTMWNDPLIAADNPGVALPARKVVPVVRSDGSGSTAQFTAWMASQHGALWDAYCGKVGRSSCGMTSNYPTLPGAGFVAQPNSQGVSGYVAQTANQGTITYVEYSYALKTGYPVAKVLNAAGYYVGPTAQKLAVGLLEARINDDEKSPAYLTQDLKGVYTSQDKRTYPLSSYSYMVVPTAAQSGFTEAKGRTLGAFANYFLCEGQQQADVLGYSPLPLNLVQAGLEQVRKIPGVVVEEIDLKTCNNPTFSKDGTNTLAKNAPMPADCDRKGAACGAGGAPTAGTPSGATPTAGTPAGGKPTGGKPTSGWGDPGTGTDGASDGTDGTGTGDTGTDGTGTDGAVDPGQAPPTDGSGEVPGGGTVIPVGATSGGGPVVCEPDSGVCTNVVALPVQVERESVAGCGLGGVVAAVLAAVVLPPVVGRALGSVRERRGSKR